MTKCWPVTQIRGHMSQQHATRISSCQIEFIICVGRLVKVEIIISHWTSEN